MTHRSNPKYVRRLSDGRYEYGRIDLSVEEEHKHRYVRHGTAATLDDALAKEHMAPLTKEEA